MSQGVTFPEWQLDTDVSECFLCSTPYNIFFRRHHCRKCGRVVCGECSAQSLHYFDNTPIASPPGIITHEGGGSGSGSGGGSNSGGGGGGSGSGSDTATGNSQIQGQYSKPNEVYRTCDECANNILIIRRVLFNNPDSCQINEEIRDNRFIKHANSREYTRHVNSSSHTPPSPSLSEIRGRGRGRALGASKARDSSSEGNLCPVCATDLLKEYIELRNNIENISTQDFEKFKEEHINECLTKFDFNTDHSCRFSPGSNPRNKMLVYNIPPIPEPQYESIDEIARENMAGPPSEKSEELNECVICLEDLKPGDKVGRLECLCVFHYKCIKDWFNKKGYGECPVHFLHK
ncbi:hypothetical protein KGF56_000194 [Candida oxycetoniae]|uniref:RING-type E3 ubiquitin transferase n=1 Tax=Candida oxycetoniae TaxID=497107 RepID=A0AAI9T1U9_9ASCO|nr:uncharacterized protein KGF56_000194 [Candida oxycetoniae]KAI3406902.2 hypothetical protein KGF56_000194 [Candida oxycetoniae]